MAGAVSKPVELVFTRDNTRRYVIWEGEIDGQHIVTHGFGALFPETYLPSCSAETSIWHCPVRTCGQAYATPPDLGDHFVRFHAGAILHDHLDGTFSVLLQDPETAYDANCQPYVASQGHMLPSPSLRQPSHSVPLHPGPSAQDTPPVAVDRHDKSRPQTGNNPPSSSSEANSDNESDRRSGSDSDGSDNTDESGGSDSDESDRCDDNNSEASDDAFNLAMISQHLNQKKRKADNDQIAPEPKKVKTVSVPAEKDSATIRKGKHELRRYRMSNSRQQPAIWEQKWGRLSRSGPKQDYKHAALAYSASSVAKGRVIADDGTRMLVLKIKGTSGHTIDTKKRGTVNDMICTVRDAIIIVNITGEEPFTIFPEGCWHIKAGQVCSIRNRYRDAEATVQIYSKPVRTKED